jgi:hypothetical protein
VKFEGDTLMRVVHLAFVLIDGLLCMILRTIAPCDCWFYLIPWTLTDLGAPDMVLEDVPVISPRMLCTLCRT